MTRAIILSTIVICLWTSLSAQTANSKNGAIARESDWGFSADLFLGYGTFTGDLRKKYKSYIPLGICLDLSYKNFVLHGIIQGGYGRTKKDIRYDTASTWPKRSLFEVVTPGLFAGYIVSETRDFKMEPFAGLSFMINGPASDIFPKDDSVKNVVFDKVTFYTIGFNFDLLGGFMKRNPSILWSLRVRYIYNFRLVGVGRESTTGSMHSLTLGACFLTRRFK